MTLTAPSSASAVDNPLHCVHYLDAVRLEAGGVVRAVLDLIEALSRAGVTVTLLTGDDQDVPHCWRAEEPDTPTVVKINRARSPLLKLGAADREAVDRAFSQADVLHLHTPWDQYNVALATEARHRRLPYVISIHGMLDHWSMTQKYLKKRLYLQLIGRWMLRNAYALHLTAEAEANQALGYAPGANGRVLPLVLDLAPYANPPGPDLAREAFPALATETPKLLFLSRVHPKKGVERLIEATAGLRAQGRPVEAFIAGPGDDAYVDGLKQRASQLGISECVHFLGMVRGETKLSLYRACDAFVLPTSQENFGIVLAEAMACGLPTVTTHGVDIALELQAFGAAIVSDVAEPGEGELARAIAGLLDDPTPAESAARAQAGVLDWLDPQRVVDSYIALYRDASTAK